MSEAEVLTALAWRSKAFWGYSNDLMQRFAPDLLIAADSIEREEVRVLQNGSSMILGVYRLAIANRLAEVEAFWIEPTMLRRGLGRMLWDDLLATAHFRGAYAIELDADPNARHFYERMGARYIGATQSTLVENRALPRLRFDIDKFAAGSVGDRLAQQS